ncbi:hypothetical protein ACFYP4_02440 [Streptomyces sp. NPDC005551]|uniref:hypothetical protein n=1 Tax=Streptomyces sp. NPDC005551 TaxID=3364725 RepID=UPI0036BFDD50
MSEAGCTARAALSEAEAKHFNELEDAEHAVDTDPGLCELDTHGPEVRHVMMVQNQYDGETSTSWWLRWDDAGEREIKVEPYCDRPMEDPGQFCLLVAEHLGQCSYGTDDTHDDEDSEPFEEFVPLTEEELDQKLPGTDMSIREMIPDNAFEWMHNK